PWPTWWRARGRARRRPTSRRSSSSAARPMPTRAGWSSSRPFRSAARASSTASRSGIAPAPRPSANDRPRLSPPRVTPRIMPSILKEASMSRVSRRHFLSITAGGSLALAATPLLWRHARANEEIRIGALCELSGVASTIGVPQSEGIKMAVDEINKTGGILGKGPGVGGRPLKLIVEDTESKVQTGVTKAKKLVERDKVDALTGVIFSAISLSVQEYVNKDAKVPFLNAGSGNPALSEPPACGKYSFQGSPNSRILCLPSLYAAKKFGPKWFLIGDDYTWGRLSVDLTKQAIKLGSPLEVVGEEFPPLGTTNYAPYIT